MLVLISKRWFVDNWHSVTAGELLISISVASFPCREICMKILIECFFVSLFYENHKSSLANNDALNCSSINFPVWTTTRNSPCWWDQISHAHVFHWQKSFCVLHFSEIKLNKVKQKVRMFNLTKGAPYVCQMNPRTADVEL